MKEKKPKYSGVLAAPMTHHVAPAKSQREQFVQNLCSLNVASDADEASRLNKEQIEVRLTELARLHNVPMGKDWALFTLWAVARDYIPGFKFRDELPTSKKKGAPQKWGNSDRFLELMVDVHLLKHEGHSVVNAFRVLTSSTRFKAKYGGEKAATLKRRYYELIERQEASQRALTEIINRTPSK